MNCPKCSKKLSLVESDYGKEEWECENEECTVSVVIIYYVQKPSKSSPYKPLK